MCVGLAFVFAVFVFCERQASMPNKDIRRNKLLQKNAATSNLVRKSMEKHICLLSSLRHRAVP